MANMINRISNTVALVTGGASGLGLATVKRLLEQGAKGVVSLDLKKPELQNPKLLSVTGDICKEADVEEALKQVEAKFGNLNALVNCAGIAVAAKIYDERRAKPHPMDEFKRCLEVNVVGTFNVTRLACGMLAKGEMEPNGQKGVIIMTSSIASYDAQRGQTAYAASKGAINGMTLAIARDMAVHGVRCMTIAPGVFSTPMVVAMNDKVKNALAAMVPCPKRFGDPDEYAHLVQSIIENPMLNGEIIRIDGATRFQP